MRKIDEQSRAALLDCLRRTYDKLCVMDGGPGSGNFGHGGRPGELGGSSPSGTGAPSAKSGGQSTKRYSKAEIEAMPLSKLRKETAKVATAYYKSGLSGVYFGNTPPEKAAEMLTAQSSPAQLKKALASMQKKMATAK